MGEMTATDKAVILKMNQKRLLHQIEFQSQDLIFFCI